MKTRLMSALIALLLFAACTPMEEKRDAHMATARTLEQEDRCAEAKLEAEQAMALDPTYAGGHLLIARCDLKENKLESAAEHFDRALTIAPDSLDALLGLGRLALLSDHLNEAEDYAKKAEALGDDSLDLTVIRSGILMKRKQYAEAQPLLEKALAIAPRNEETVVGLAAAYINTSQREKAKELLTASLELLPGSPAVQSLLLTMAVQDGDHATAEAYLKKMRESDPEDEGLTLQLSDLFVIRGKPEEGRQALRDFLKTYPEAMLVRMRLAEMEIAQGRFDEALALLDAAPKQSGALGLDKASILLRAGRLDEGIALLKHIADDPQAEKVERERARMGLAEIYFQQGKAEDAEKELQTVLKANPANLNALFMRGSLHLGKKRYAEAEADLETVVKGSPDNLPAHIALAEAVNGTGNPGLAEALITRVNQRAPKFAQGYVAMANLYLSQGKPEAALMTLRMGKTEIPGNPTLMVAEADILTALKRYGEAKTALEALAKEPAYAETALLRLADVHALADEPAKAATVFERLAKLNPDLPGVQHARIQALIAAKQEKAALAAAEKLQKEQPDDPGIALLTAEAALAGKNKKKAEAGFLRALELRPQWEQPLAAIVQMYVADKRLDDAIKLCKSLEAKAPDAAGPGFFAGMLHERKGDRDAAEKAYREVLAKHPTMKPAANNLAFLLSSGQAKPERLMEAEKLARTAAEGGAPSALDTLGWIQHRLGKHAEAEENLRKAHAAYQDSPVVSYHLASTLAALGKSDAKSEEGKAKLAEARKLLEQMLARKGSFPYQNEAKKLLAEIRAVK